MLTILCEKAIGHVRDRPFNEAKVYIVFSVDLFDEQGRTIIWISVKPF